MLNNLGQSYIRLRQYEKAIENLEPALVIAREVKRRTGEGNTLTGLGDAYSGLGIPSGQSDTTNRRWPSIGR